MSLSEDFISRFKGLEDPRLQNHNYRHNLEDILCISLLGIICGADTWVDVVEFAKSKEEFLRSFLELPNGIASHDTFGRVFANIDSEKFNKCFADWAESFSARLDFAKSKEIISVDGKTARGSCDKNKHQNPLHMVGAWAKEQGISLGQLSTKAKSN